MAPTAAEAKPEDPVIEDAGSDSEDEMPGLEDTAAGANDENADTNAAAGADDGEGKGKQSRGEKKARKTLSKLGLKQVRSGEVDSTERVALLRNEVNQSWWYKGKRPLS